MNRERVSKYVLVLLTLAISAVFLSMIRQFLMAIFLAGLFTAMAHPMYCRFERWFAGRRSLASLATLLLIVLVILLPLVVLFGVVTAQAVRVGQSATPWVEKQISEPGALTETLQKIPLYRHIEPYRSEILQKAGQMVGRASRFLINSLSSLTLGTVNFLFMFFVLLYTMFFFLMDGDKLLDKILYYLPLKPQEEQRLLERFTSVTRATLKGTLVIGLLQGGLCGGAFAVAGISSAVFWGTIMVVLSIIPGIGTALVWVPAVFILGISGHLVKALLLAVFCALVAGSVDNFLRPTLVGRDTKMHELLIFFGTLGGIVMFGVIGIIIGPIIAALFTTVWDIYGTVFQDYLPEASALPGNASGESSGDAPEKNRQD
jgi:predicted PurR-regulated permease PerM